MAAKRIYETDEVKSFVAGMSSASKRKYMQARQVLADFGDLRYPLGEKVDGYDDVFVIRILTKGNERFFYCFDEGDIIAVLHGFSKKTQRIQQRELSRALRVMNQLFGGEA